MTSSALKGLGLIVDRIDSDLHKFRPQDTTVGAAQPADPFAKKKSNP